jgi:hypothetical protein
LNETARLHHVARRSRGVAARIAHEMKDLDAKQTMLQGAIRAEAQASLPQSN